MKGGMRISIYQTIKAAVTTRQAAEFYGQSVSPNGMTLCPFHEDHHPSMKVAEKFRCFACGAYGDVIDYVAKLFELSPYETAQKLAADFGINVDDDAPQVIAKPKPRDMEQRCFAALNRYRQLLIQRKDFYTPQTFDGPYTYGYRDTDEELLRIEHWLDILIEPYGNRRMQVVDYMTESNRLQRLEHYLTQLREEVKT